jgi:hypothetical protein
MAPALALKALTQLHSRNAPAPARAPLTTEQRNVNRVAREEKQDEIDLAVQAWFSSTVALAEELATKHSKKPRHFLDLFFHGGAKMLTQRSSTNSWNAWSSITAGQENGGELTMESMESLLKWGIDTDRRSNLIDIQEEQHHEYLALTQEAKDKLVHDFDLEKGQRKTAVRISSRGRIQDVSNAARNIELIVSLTGNVLCLLLLTSSHSCKGSGFALALKAFLLLLKHQAHSIWLCTGTLHPLS